MCLYREGGKSDMVHLPLARRPGGEDNKKSGRAETAQGRRKNRMTKAAGQGGSGA